MVPLQEVLRNLLITGFRFFSQDIFLYVSLQCVVKKRGTQLEGYKKYVYMCIVGSESSQFRKWSRYKKFQGICVKIINIIKDHIRIESTRVDMLRVDNIQKNWTLRSYFLPAYIFIVERTLYLLIQKQQQILPCKQHSKQILQVKLCFVNKSQGVRFTQMQILSKFLQFSLTFHLLQCDKFQVFSSVTMTLVLTILGCRIFTVIVDVQNFN
eukprot:TRINITY_DN62760_c0_g1_i1.p1 TRINITY_DN62760_c0_g1~~TRINITY_DN62760_c0_g1_i1.p1  ORF type:complete len:211 (+),score=-11.57 TRINITY_DN62760_c0_g1_i1:173-805(+)